MVKYIDQQQWSKLAHIVMHGLEDSKDFEVFRDDRFTTLGKPILIHQKLFKSFLLYYKWQTLWEEEGPSEAEVMCWTPEEFETYLTRKAFHDDLLNIMVHGLAFLLDHPTVVETKAEVD
jgi:hypothetical protein